jgi:hypothetical protein
MDEAGLARQAAPALASWARRHAGLLTAAGLALLALGPLLRPGFVLTYDMLFTPWPRLHAGLLGLGGDVPRSVPSDLLVALAGHVLPPDLVQKAVLAGVMVGAALGAARLAPTGSTAGRAAAAALYGWNALVYERLMMGHWALLIGYAAMPWVASAAIAWRAGRPGAGTRLGLALAVAACGSPHGSVLAAGLAAAIMFMPARAPWRARPWPRLPAPARAASSARRAALTCTGMILILNGPWLVPALLLPGGIPVREAGAAAFAARPDTPLGTWGSLATLGGIWNELAVPPGRGSPLWLPGFAVLLVLAIAGWRLIPSRIGRGAAAGLLLAAALGLIVAGAWSVPFLRPAVLFVVERLPGGGLLRDAHKHVAPLALVQAVGLAVGVERLLARVKAPASRRLTGAVIALGPVLLLPSLALGLGGRLAAVPYPPSWGQAREVVAADPVPGAVLVLPWHRYLALPWNGGRVVINPALHAFPRRVVLNDDLELPAVTVAGEDPFTAALSPLVRGDGQLAPDLAAAGIRYVVVLRGGASTGGPSAAVPDAAPAMLAARALDREAATAEGRLAGAGRVLSLPDLALYRLEPAIQAGSTVTVGPAAAARLEAKSVPAVPVLVADLAAGALACWLLVRASTMTWRDRRRSRAGNGTAERSRS